MAGCAGWNVSEPDEHNRQANSGVGVLPLTTTERYNYEGLSLTLAGTDTIKGNVNPENIKKEQTEVGRYRPVDGYRDNDSKGNPTGARNFASRGLQIVSENGTRGQINYTTDLRGSVRYETTTKDSKTETYNYDVFGESIGKTPEFFGYTGKPFDPQTKMYNYGYRDYTPKTGRFTTQDPIRDGSNWFAYVENDPVNFIDRWGLDKTPNYMFTVTNVTIEVQSIDGPKIENKTIVGSNLDAVYQKWLAEHKNASKEQTEKPKQTGANSTNLFPKYPQSDQYWTYYQKTLSSSKSTTISAINPYDPNKVKGEVEACPLETNK